MSDPTELELLHGADEPLQAMRELRAGPLSVQLSEGDLRYVRLGEHELVRRIYVAVRDQAWGTVPGKRSREVVEEQADGFRVGFEARHLRGAVDFRWRCQIVGRADGTLTYAMDGAAARDFPYMRVGICVLHPIAGMAGRPVRGRGPAGAFSGELPRLIGRQEVVDGECLPLIQPMNELAIELEAGGELRFEFEGDSFELEDQRNWTDASFKSFSHNPISRVEPWRLHAGDEVRHRVTVTPPSRTAATPGASPVTGARNCTIEIGSASEGELPRLGLALPADGAPSSRREAELLGALGVQHLRAEVHAGASDVQAAIEAAIAQCERLGCPLEVALFADDRSRRGLQSICDRLRLAPVDRVAVFDEDSDITPSDLVEEVRRCLGTPLPAMAIGGGTNNHFADLNRDPVDPGLVDFIAYPIAPQVHAADDLSLMEAPAAQEDTLATARSLFGDLPLSVGPITLKPRFNVDAPPGLTPEEPAPGAPPDDVDHRQMSLAAAAWTVASVKYLARGGAAAATYFETVGWRGVIESARGPASPAFASRSGMTFPVYHVLADLAPWAGRPLIQSTSSEPLAADALCLDTARGLLLLVANTGPTATRAVVTGLPDGGARLRTLSASSAARAAADPLEFRRASTRTAVTAGTLSLDLQPYSVATLDVPG